MAREVLDTLASHIRPGITTDELDAICHEECIKRNAYPSPLNYNKFPKSVCTSVNEVICHVSDPSDALCPPTCHADIVLGDS
jgi:methionyl aminopeptidase